MLGSIPEEIIYVYKGAIDASFAFDDLQTDVSTTDQVIPTFPVDATVATTLKRAREWAANTGVYTQKGYVRTKGKVTESKRKNIPFEGLKLITLEHRSEGGRAWKVVDKDGHYFDLREDVLLDTLKTEGTGPGGQIKGKFLWGKVGSQMKLVREGSKLHEKLIEGTRRKALEPLTKADIVPGGVYMTKGQKIQICLGSANGKHPFMYYNIPTWRRDIATMEDYERDTREKLASYRPNSPNHWDFKILKTANFVEKITTIKLPKNTVEKIEHAFLIKGKDNLADYLAK